MCTKERAIASSESHLNYKLQERLYKAACVPFPEDDLYHPYAHKNDTPTEAAARAIRVAKAAKIANAKISKMWDANKEKFACKNFNNVSVPGGNLLKFSIDNGFPEVLTFFVIEYQLDVNFKDPVDGRTIMDFLYWKLGGYKNSGNKNQVVEYEEAIAALKAYGAKTSAELERK